MSDEIPTDSEPTDARLPPAAASLETTAYEDLIAECLERLDHGGTAAMEQVIGQHPGDAARIRSDLERLRRSGLLPAAPDPDFPDRLGDFRLIRRIGGGGMGVVFLARQESLGREVALKLVRPDYLFFDNARKRFQREVQAVARLQHPGIVPVWHIGEENGIPYFAMEYVHGCSLAEVLVRVRASRRADGSDRQTRAELRGRRVREVILAAAASASSSDGNISSARLFTGSWERVCLRIALHVAEALVHAHEQQIVHRDIKPSNVMVTADGQVKLVDFGLAFLEADEKLTRSNAVLGSLNYMSPEQLSRDTVDHRADVYSLGATLYELLSLQTPFGDGDAATLSERILQGDLPPLRRIGPGVSRDTETICETAMAVKREHRYRDMQAFADDLRNVLDLHPIHARPPSLSRRTTRWVQRNAVLSMAALLLAVIAVFSSVMWWQQRLANQILRAERQRAEGNLVAAVEANEKLTAERARSIENFAMARKAIDQMLARVANRNLVGVPYMSRIRQHLMADALRLYTELSENNQRTEETELDLFAMELNLANRHRSLADMKQAEELCRSAILRIEALVAKNPATRLTFQRARARALLAVILDRNGRTREGEGILRECVLAMEGHIDEMLDDPLLAGGLAYCYRELATVYDSYPDLRPAEPAWQRDFDTLALTLRERIYERHPANASLRDILAREYRRSGTLHINRERLQQGLRYIDKALALYAATDVARLSGTTIFNIASSHGARAAAFEKLGKRAESRAARDQEIALRERLVAEDPEAPEYHGMLGAALNNSAIAHLAEGNLDRAEKEARRAVEHQLQAMKALPRHPDFRGYLRNHTYVLCRLYDEWRRPEELAQQAHLLAGRDPNRARGQYDAAVFLAAALAQRAQLDDAGDAGDAPVRTWVREQRQRLFSLLQESVDAGYATAARLGAPRLVSLREAPEYRDLLARARARARARSAPDSKR